MHWQVSAAEPWQGRRGWCLFDCTGQVAVLLLATERNTSREFLLLQAFHDLVLSHGRRTRIAGAGLWQGRPGSGTGERLAICDSDSMPDSECYRAALRSRFAGSSSHYQLVYTVRRNKSPCCLVCRSRPRRPYSAGPMANHTAGAQRCDRRDGSVAARWLQCDSGPPRFAPKGHHTPA